MKYFFTIFRVKEPAPKRRGRENYIEPSVSLVKT
jgi:hypothetical protein